jgi:hypothetical protein
LYKIRKAKSTKLKAQSSKIGFEMKRCPTCNQTFDEEWLSFCTQDGTSLVDTEALPEQPPPTIRAPAMPPSVSPSEQSTFNLPGSYSPPPALFSQPQPLQSAWQPPPPPARASAPQQSLAVASLILGLVSITVGWCCYFGVLTSPIAIGLGIASLSQIKKDPSQYTGKPLAIIGITTGSLYFVFLVLIILLYGLSFLMHGWQ